MSDPIPITPKDGFAVTPGIIALILQYGLQYGIPAIAAIVKLFQTTNPTDADWAALIASCSITARQQMLAALQKAGIDPASPQGVALLALTPA